MVLYHLQSPELWEVRAKITLKSLERLKIGLSRSSLHTKAFLIDREKLFIGSFNWDPRSADINTEMGIVLDSPGLATEAGDAIDASLSRIAFQLQLSSQGEIEWVVREDGSEIVYDSEPETSFGRRLAVKFYSLLPIEDQL